MESYMHNLYNTEKISCWITYIYIYIYIHTYIRTYVRTLLWSI